jgi:hypothetical protein
MSIVVIETKIKMEVQISGMYILAAWTINGANARQDFPDLYFKKHM